MTRRDSDLDEIERRYYNGDLWPSDIPVAIQAAKNARNELETLRADRDADRTIWIEQLQKISAMTEALTVKIAPYLDGQVVMSFAQEELSLIEAAVAARIATVYTDQEEKRLLALHNRIFARIYQPVRR